MKKLNILLSGLALCGMALTSCDNDPVLPPVSFPEGGSLETVGTGTEESPLAVWQVLLGKDAGTDEEGIAQTLGWAEGYIVGYCDTGVASVLSADNAVFSAKGAVASNVLLANTPDETNWENCIGLRLARDTPEMEAARNALNLSDNPRNLGKKVKVFGTLGSKYVGVYGVRDVSAYVWVESDQPSEPVGPTIFNKVSSVQSGLKYALVADGKYMATLLGGSGGYIKVAEVDAGDSFEGSADDAYTFTAEGSHWIITDSMDRYLYLSGTYNGFNVSDALPTEGYLWDVTIDADGKATITNVDKGKTIEYNTQYGSYGCYPDLRGALPVLYVLTSNN